MGDFHRWNFEIDSDDRILRCINGHEKGQACEYKPLTLSEVEAMQSRLAELEALLGMSSVSLTLSRPKDE